jgi:nucleoside-diphosphate-sugar epimerase
VGAYRVVNNQHGAFCRIYNLGSDHPVSLAELIDSIAKVVGKPVRIKRMPKQPGDVERTWADVSRARVELSYQPAVAFVDGLQQQWQAQGRPQISSAAQSTPVGRSVC